MAVLYAAHPTLDTGQKLIILLGRRGTYFIPLFLTLHGMMIIVLLFSAACSFHLGLLARNKSFFETISLDKIQK